MQYESKKGQNIYDVCLQTYGVLEHLLKLVTDNNLGSVGANFEYKIFIFDENLIKDNALFNKVENEKIFYITAKSVIVPAILQENGFYLLQENGYRILLE